MRSKWGEQSLRIKAHTDILPTIKNLKQISNGTEQDIVKIIDTFIDCRIVRVGSDSLVDMCELLRD